MRGSVRLRVLLEFLILFPSILPTSRAGFANETIDDTYGDPLTGIYPTYQPVTPGIWGGSACSTCIVQPDKSLAHGGTWTAAIYNSTLQQDINVTLTFTGVAVWVFFILANNVNGSIAETTTECNFTLDGAHAGYYSHQPDINNNNLQYNVTVFNQSGLSNSPHKLVISTSGLPYDAYMNFDYAIYTADLPDTIAPTSGSSRITSVVSPATTSSSHRNDLVGIVIGSVFGGLAFVVIVCIVFLLRRLYKSRNTDMRMAHPVLEDNDNEPPTGAHYEGLTNSISQAPWQNNSHSRSDNLGQWPTSHSSGSLPGNALLSGRSPSSPDYLSSPSSSTKLRGKYSPNARNVGNQDELRALRQMEINERIQNAQQQVNALTSRQSMSPPPNERGRSVETEQEMETMREQIRQLSHQIGNMQHERQSDWAMGLSDDAPPAYS